MEVFKGRSQTLVQSAAVIVMAAMLVLFGTGCITQEVTSPPRSATEQLLLSTAADRAMAGVNLSMFDGKSIYLDFTYFDSYDSKYAEGEIRDALSRAGAILAPDIKSADVIIEPRSGVYSADTNSTFFGIPSIPLPVPSTAEIPVFPSIAFYQRSEQISYAKFALLAYSKKTRAHIYSSGPLDGNAYNTYRAILFVSWWRSDVPEKNKGKRKQKFETWGPQYDPGNMPAAPPGPNH
jgi:hypothetical protein